MTIKLTFLGTSGQMPSAKRNHTSVLLSWNNENILVDCGEGTQRQIRKARLNPCKITRILITHWHGDHVLGLPGLLQTLALSGYNKTLYIYGPKRTKQFVKEITKLFGFSNEFKIIVEEIKGKFFENEDFYLESFPVYHRIPCNGYNFVKKGKIRINKIKLKKAKLPQGPLLKNLTQGKNIKYKGKTYKSKDLTFKEEDKKVSFVLDTKFDKKISNFVKGANICVCESSFGEDLKEHAKEHFHLTSEQAANIAKKAKAEKLILTHISQRYENDFNKILNEAKKIFKNTLIAKDFDSFEIN